jgi:hypothetical protein
MGWGCYDKAIYRWTPDGTRDMSEEEGENISDETWRGNEVTTTNKEHRTQILTKWFGIRCITMKLYLLFNYCPLLHPSYFLYYPPFFSIPSYVTPSSLARTLGSWVRIPLNARMSVCVYSLFVFSCVGSDLATGWSPVQGVLLTVLRLRNWIETKRFTDAKWE